MLKEYLSWRKREQKHKKLAIGLVEGRTAQVVLANKAYDAAHIRGNQVGIDEYMPDSGIYYAWQGMFRAEDKLERARWTMITHESADILEFVYKMLEARRKQKQG